MGESTGESLEARIKILESALVRCGSCGKSTSEVDSLIGSPTHDYICEECVGAYTGRSSAAEEISPDVGERSCLFCRKSTSEVKSVLAVGEFTICCECIAICNELIEEKPEHLETTVSRSLEGRIERLQVSVFEKSGGKPVFKAKPDLPSELNYLNEGKPDLTPEQLAACVSQLEQVRAL